MSLYRRKPVIVEARLFDPGADYDEACAVVRWCGGTATNEGCVIPTIEGPLLASPGYFIIKGVQGEFWGVAPDVFALTYEPAPDGES